MRIHLIAIGGAVMHNLAMALHNKDFRVTGFDHKAFEPSHYSPVSSDYYWLG